MRIAVHGRDFRKKSPRFVENVLSLLKAEGAEILLSEKFAHYFKRPDQYTLFSKPEELEKVNFFISIGGDGTMLDSITYIGKKEIPILGINTGRLGFLATISKEETDAAIRSLIKGKYKISSRSLLKLESKTKVFGEFPFALNDFTIMKKDNSMIRVEVLVDQEPLNAYWADGLIVATPTGSTGYSLSCGGPLIHPQSESFIITPVSPHNLTMRPMVLSDKVELEFRMQSRVKKLQISLDSRFENIDEGWTLKIKKAPFKIKLIQLSHHHFFDTLRQKLNWGLDIRN